MRGFTNPIEFIFISVCPNQHYQDPFNQESTNPTLSQLGPLRPTCDTYTSFCYRDWITVLLKQTGFARTPAHPCHKSLPTLEQPFSAACIFLVSPKIISKSNCWLQNQKPWVQPSLLKHFTCYRSHAGIVVSLSLEY